MAGRVNAVVETSRKPKTSDVDVDPLQLAARCYFDVKQEAADYHVTKQDMMVAFAKQGIGGNDGVWLVLGLYLIHGYYSMIQSVCNIS